MSLLINQCKQQIYCKSFAFETLPSFVREKSNVQRTHISGILWIKFKFIILSCPTQVSSITTKVSMATPHQVPVSGGILRPLEAEVMALSFPILFPLGRGCMHPGLRDTGGRSTPSATGVSQHQAMPQIPLLLAQALDKRAP